MNNKFHPFKLKNNIIDEMINKEIISNNEEPYLHESYRKNNRKVRKLNQKKKKNNNKVDYIQQQSKCKFKLETRYLSKIQLPDYINESHNIIWSYYTSIYNLNKKNTQLGKPIKNKPLKDGFIKQNIISFFNKENISKIKNFSYSQEHSLIFNVLKKINYNNSDMDIDEIKMPKDIVEEALRKVKSTSDIEDYFEYFEKPDYKFILILYYITNSFAEALDSDNDQLFENKEYYPTQNSYNLKKIIRDDFLSSSSEGNNDEQSEEES
jgi:hypothetical protein